MSYSINNPPLGQLERHDFASAWVIAASLIMLLFCLSP